MITSVNLKFIFVMMASFLLCHTGLAQDTIVKLNNARIKARIIEITPKVVKYKAYINPEGPLYILDRRQISRIIYSNGTVDTFSLKQVKTPSEIAKKDPRVTDYGKNIVSLVVSDLFYGIGSVGYERILNSGKFSFKVPVSIGFHAAGMKDSVKQYNDYSYNNTWGSAGYYYKYKVFSTGLELYYYTGGQGTFRYFIGPSIEYGQFNYGLYILTSQNPYDGYYKKDRGSYTAFLVKNGVVFQPAKNLNVSFNLGAGIYFSKTDFQDDYVPGPFEVIYDAGAFEFGLNVAYRF